MKKVQFAAIIIILLAVVSLIVLKVSFLTDSPEKQLENAFKSSGAQIVSSELYFKGKIESTRSTSLQGLEKIASDLAAGLGCMKGEFTTKTVSNEELQGVEISGTSGKGLSIGISAVKSTNGAQPYNCYITASAVDKDGTSSIDATRKAVLSILGRYGINPSINSCITGSYQGKLDNNRLNGICINIFKTAGARKVEGISEKNLISVSAYTPSIGEAVEVNGHKVNLNLAVRYNSYENKTYIWLATPVITTEY